MMLLINYFICMERIIKMLNETMLFERRDWLINYDMYSKHIKVCRKSFTSKISLDYIVGSILQLPMYVVQCTLNKVSVYVWRMYFHKRFCWLLMLFVHIQQLTMKMGVVTQKGLLYPSFEFEQASLCTLLTLYWLEL